MKYELTGETMTFSHGGDNFKLYRIRALVKVADDVHAGDLGGWVSSEENLSQVGECWVYDNAMVFGSGWVRDNAQVRGKSIVCNKGLVTDNAIVNNSYIGCRCLVARDSSVLSLGKKELKQLILNDCYINNGIDDFITVKGVGEVSGIYMIVGGIYNVFKRYGNYQMTFQYDYVAGKKREKEELERMEKRKR